MTTDTKFGLDISLGTASGGYVLLRVLADENGAPQYEEEDISGGEVLNAQDGEHFSDVFDSWHLGGFLAEHVQNGFYYRARNVDCTVPGKIRPSPKRHGTFTVDATATRQKYGVAGLAYRTGDELFIFARRENAAADNAATCITASTFRLSTLTEFSLGLSGTSLDTTAADIFGTTGAGFTNIIRPLKVVQGSAVYFLVPLGREYVLIDSAAINATVAKGAHAFARGLGRYFAVDIQSGGELAISNIDAAAALNAAGNWTTVVRIGAFDRGALEPDPAGVTLIVLNGIPYIGTPTGLYVLAAGGVPHNLTQQFGSAPVGRGNFAALIPISRGGAVAGLFGANRLGLFSPTGNWSLEGPGANPLTAPEETIVMDIHESTSGDLWVYVFFPNRAVATGTWEIWCGKLQPDGRYAWHQIWTDQNASEGGPVLNTGADNDEKAANASLRPMLPSVANVDGTLYYRFLAGTGHNATNSLLTSFDSRLFYALTPQHENNEAHEIGTDYDVTVQWRSGRFSRHDKRVFRHWTDIRFLGENIGAAAALGGRILVEVAFDGGAFGNPGGGSAIYLTSNDQVVTVDNYARDIEVQLTWQLDGVTGTGATAMQNAPATVTLIQYEGREVPNTMKRITMLVDSDHPAQAGGTRVKRDAKGAMTALETTAKATVKQTFRDPFKVNRTVSLLKMKKLSLSECKRMKVPEGALRLVLLEAV